MHRKGITRRPEPSLSLAAAIRLAAVLSCAPVLLAQDVGTNPPDLAPPVGLSPLGAYAPGQIESVNTVNGNVMLRFPVGSLPPGPGGFSAGVSLVYNSAIYDVPEVGYADGTAAFQYNPSENGGGWTYGYKYALWAQGRIGGIVTQEELNYFWKNFLRTPDGNNHELYLISSNPVINASQDQYGFSQVTFDGVVGIYDPAHFYSGTLVFATADSTFIRVEENTSSSQVGTLPAQTFKIFLPDGTTATGPLFQLGLGTLQTAATQITDINNNTLTIEPICAPGQQCTDVLTDGQGRTVSVNYYETSDQSGWTDTIVSPGPNQSNTSTVTWSNLPAPNLTYNYRVDLSGAAQQTQSLVTGYAAVTGLQMPSADNVNSVFYNFGYTASPGMNSWGEMHSAAECAGTSAASCVSEWAVNYTYHFDTGSSLIRPAGTLVNPIQTKILSYFDALLQNTWSEKTTYNIQYPSSPFATYPQGLLPTPNTVTGPDNTTTAIYLASLCTTAQVARDSCAPLVYKTINPDQSTTEMGWVSNVMPGGTAISSGTIWNPYVQWRAETRPGSASNTARATFISRDINGNMVTLNQYDWAAPTSVTRSGSLISGFLCSGAGCPIVSQTTTYNNTAYDYWNQGAPLLHQPYRQSTNGQTLTTYSYDSNGNPNQVQQLDDKRNVQISQSRLYLSNGNPWAEFDANNNVALTCYDGQNLYPMTRLVGASGVTATTTYSASLCGQGYPEARTFSFNYDGLSGAGSGVLLSSTDVDNHLATNYTYDNLGRQRTSAQSGPTLTRNTNTVYDDVGLQVTAKQDDTAAGQLVSIVNYDALGRVRYTKDGAGNQVTKAYAYGIGLSYEIQSNPYTAASATTETDATMGWTLTTRDPAGRVVTVQNFPGAPNGSALGPPAPWGQNNTTVTGSSSTKYDQGFTNCSNPGTTTTDEALNTLQYCSDGLGRLITVIEPAASGNPATVTRYRYDVRNNLASVDVDGQPDASCTINSTTHMRCFSYSTLSRLNSASNPESGTVSYTYDNNGNLLTRSDAIGNTMTVSAFDHLNRPIGASAGAPAIKYTVAGTSVTTPNITYSYDHDFKGAISSVSTSASTTAYTHDDYGRIASNTQTTNGNAYTFSYAYSSTGFLTSIQYPSGRTVAYTPDAADRIASVTNVTGGANANYAAFSYKASGAVNTMTTGNNLVTQQFSWNDRIQPTGLTVTGPGPSALLTLGFSPCPGSATVTACATGNNGNLQWQTIAMPGLSLTQQYSYDALNRLTGAQETGTANGTGTPGWTQGYGFDPLGNRYVTTNTSGAGQLPGTTLETPASGSWFSTTVANRIVANNWNYDLAGNVLQVGGMARSFTYDAENRQVTANLNGAVSTYLYDGLGQRVSKTANGATVTYIYDAFGNVGAEYSTVAEASACGTATCYTAMDHLGSTRLLTDLSGTVQRRYDYLPFGQELLGGTDGRSSGYQSSADDTNPKFTGQPRDQETGIDWFQTRYMSGAGGRFQSVDPGNAGADPTNPQSWNGYSYVGNNPLSYTDPSGMFLCGTCVGLETGNPVGIAIGVAIDIGGLLLGDLFGGGGPVAVPPSTASPISGSASDDVWNEQIPGQGPGSINTGTLFGSGNTSPFVFSAMAAGQGGPAWWDLPGQWFVGFGDLVFNNKPSGAARMAYAVGAELVAGVAVGKAAGAATRVFSTETTIHGAERVADASRLAARQTVVTRILATGKYTQADGATVFVREVGGYYDVVVENPTTGRIITNLKHLNAKALGNLARNYGWH